MTMDYCVLFGPVITVVVSVLKRIPFVARYPKVVAAIITAALAGARVVVPDGVPVNVAEIARCVAEVFAASVATFEIAKSVRSGA